MRSIGPSRRGTCGWLPPGRDRRGPRSSLRRGLIGPNGAVNLLRTTTFAGYHDGEEHYVTAFQFAGGGGAFGR